MYTETHSTVDFFALQPRSDVAVITNPVRLNAPSLKDYFFEHIDSDSAIDKYPDHYSLILVESEDEYGISYGRLLHVSNSIENLNMYAAFNNFKYALLHYVTGRNLL